jgi:hypothetical protein
VQQSALRWVTVLLMQKTLRLLLSALLSLVLVACGGKGDSASAPIDFVATAGDGQVTLTWTAAPGVEYWLWYAPGTLAVGQDILQASGHRSAQPATSPFILAVNNANAPYTFTIDGRTGGGPGGPKAAFQYATSRPAGTNWTAGNLNTTTTNTLRAATFGQDSSGAYNFLAVGDTRTLYYKSTTDADSANWTQITSATTIGSNANLNAAAYASGRFLVGDSTGNIYYSTDLSTWTATAARPASINAMATNGTAAVAVGNGGVVWYAADGITWVAATAVPAGTPNLRGVSYLASGYWVAVGDSGTIWLSTDAVNWFVPTGYTAVSQSLYGVAYRPALTINPVDGSAVTYSAQYVFVGSSGRYVSTNDLTNWSSGTVAGAANLTAVSGTASQFLAVDSAGKAFKLVDGTTWSSAITASSAGLNAAINTMGLLNITARYVAVGANGQIVYSR